MITYVFSDLNSVVTSQLTSNRTINILIHFIFNYCLEANDIIIISNRRIKITKIIKLTKENLDKDSAIDSKPVVAIIETNRPIPIIRKNINANVLFTISSWGKGRISLPD